MEMRDQPAGTSRVIRRKLLPPPIPSTVIRRPRIEALLAPLIEQQRVVCVYATAGSGKTTAVLQAACRLNRPLAWLDVDATDAATGRLLTYLEAALAAHVPSVRGVADAALAAQLPHAEVAGLLAEAVDDSQVLLVLDDMERLAKAPEALTVVAAFARYLPPQARLVLLSRCELHLGAEAAAPFAAWIAGVGEEDLAFTVQEAADALTLSGRSDVDPVEAVVETGGWVTGVLFEAWRSSGHVIGIGGEADPLHGYLASQILSQLEPTEREFLVSTSILHEVTAESARALGIADAAAILPALRLLRLPVSWDRSGKAVQYHPRFREYLLELFCRRRPSEVTALRRAHARLLVERQHYEEAVEEFLAADAPDEATTVVEQVIHEVIERTDFVVAERWLEQLDQQSRQERTALVTAELMLAVAREDYATGVSIADRLARSGTREQIAARSARAASLMAWCYLHAGRVRDIDALLKVAATGDETSAMRYAMRVVRDLPDDPEQTAGLRSGGPLDALVMRTHYDLGRLPLLGEPPTSPWAAKAAEPWHINALAATGHIEQAFEMYQRIEQLHDPGVWLSAVFGPMLMRDLGEQQAAWRQLRVGRERVTASGSDLFLMYSMLLEAELELGLHADPIAARRVLQRIQTHHVGGCYALIVERTEALLGLAALVEGDHEGARKHLRDAVASMCRGGRDLLLPPTAVYLAEAEWRAGDEDAADVAANLALEAAGRQESNHILLEALSKFPTVLSRRLDLEPTSDSAWHDLGRALLAGGVDISGVLPASLQVTEFGSIGILVGGLEVQPGLKKSYELLCYLAYRDREVARHELLDALFDGRTDDSATAYLRQTSLRLRKAVPGVLEFDTNGGKIRLCEQIRVKTESDRFVGLLRQAAGMRGAERLGALLDALHIVDKGEYLPGVVSGWVEERRHQLVRAALDARSEAAELAFELGEYRRAAELLGAVLQSDPYRETGWRLEMRIAHALGDQDRVIAAYRSCEKALGELGTQPANTTVALLRDLRR